MIFEEIIKKGKLRLSDVNIAESFDDSLKSGLDAWVPGLGGVGCGVSLNRNRMALERYAINMKLLGDNFIPSTRISLLGEELSMPIMPAPMSGIKTNLRGSITEKEFLTAILDGGKSAGTIGMCGDSFDLTESYIVPELIKENGGIGVCKPRRKEDVIERIKLLSKAGVSSIGMDIDGLGGVMLFRSGDVTRKNEAELSEIRKSFRGPMFLKGIMSIEDAQIAYESGYDAIVVSNHGGRVMDYSLGAADVLPKIHEQFKGKMKIIVDGGVRSGYDVFIYLALGADAVLVGRTILYGVMGGGSEGVRVVLEKLESELMRAMLFTGCRELKDINENLLMKYER
jgi:4-hydroxymandelate oxidase